MIDEDDDWFDLFELSSGAPNNDSYGAICAMLTEHMVDAERVNRWLLGLMVVSLHDIGALDVGLVDGLEAISAMSPADTAIAGFDSMNTLIGLFKQQGKVKRARRTQG